MKRKLVFLILVFSFSFFIFSQTSDKAHQATSANSTGVTPLGSYGSSGKIDTINSQNGNVTITIPIVGLPGRGGATDVNVSLIYNSRLWMIHKIPVNVAPGGGYEWQPAQFGEMLLPEGWQLSTPKMDYSIVEVNKNPDPNTPPVLMDVYYLYSLNESGASHNFTNRVDFHSGFAGDPNHIYTQTYHPEGKSIDGTYMRLSLTEKANYCVVTKNDGTKLYFPYFKDSTNKIYYAIPQIHPDYIIDRNGNRAVYSWDHNELINLVPSLGNPLAMNKPFKMLQPGGFLISALLSGAAMPEFSEVRSGSSKECVCEGWIFPGTDANIAPNTDTPAYYTLNIKETIQLEPWVFLGLNDAPTCTGFTPHHVGTTLCGWYSYDSPYVKARNGKVLAIKPVSATAPSESYISMSYNIGTECVIEGQATIKVAKSAIVPQSLHIFRRPDNVEILTKEILAKNITVNLTVKLKYSDGTYIDVTDFVDWSNQNPNVVWAGYSEGFFQLISNNALGTSNITVTLNSEFSKTFQVEVVNYCMGLIYLQTGANTDPVFVDGTDYNMVKGETYYLYGYCNTGPEGSDLSVDNITSKTGCSWNSDNTSVATVVNSGNPLYKKLNILDCGDAVISMTYTSGGYSVTKSFNVHATKDHIRLAAFNTSILKGKSIPLRVQLETFDDSSTTLSSVDVTQDCVFSVANNAVLSVDSTGKVTGKTLGTKTVKIEYDHCHLSLNAPVTVFECQHPASISSSLGYKVWFEYDYEKLAADSVHPFDTYIPVLRAIWYKDANGKMQETKITYTPVSQNWTVSLWGPTNMQGGEPVYKDTILGIETITLPNGRKYTFGYDGGKNKGRGQITSVKTPLGGIISYEYDQAFLGSENIVNQYFPIDVVKYRTESMGDNHYKWEYAYQRVDDSGGQPVENVTTIKDPLENKTVIKFKGFTNNRLEYMTEYYQGLSTLLRRVEKEWDVSDAPPYDMDWAGIYGSKKQYINPQLSWEKTRDYSGGGSAGKKTTYEYTKFTGDMGPYCPDGLPKTITEYEITAAGAENSKRTTVREYMHYQNSAKNNNYLDNNLIGLLSHETIFNAANGKEKERLLYYDSHDLDTTPQGATCHLSSPPTGEYRGNLTEVVDKFVAGTSGSNRSTNYYYNHYGNMYKSEDGKGFATNYIFSTATNYGQPDSIENPKSQKTVMTYSPHNGYLSTVQDPNYLVSQKNSHTYDKMGRLVQTDYPDGGQVQNVYSDSVTVGNFTITRKVKQSAAVYIQTISELDGFGRVITIKTVDPDEKDIFSEIQYDELGRKWKESNPYRANQTKYWTTYAYDALNRVLSITTDDDANSVSNNFGLNTVKSTDQAGKWRQYTYDSLGNLVQTDEMEMGSTAYAYDAAGNLLSVNQNNDGRIRNFQYNSLGDLEFEFHPELGTAEQEKGSIGYTHDGNGNIETKTDSHGKYIYSYDKLNRLETEKFQGQTDPETTYYYDGFNPFGAQFANQKGYLTGVSTNRLRESYQYDLMGRLVKKTSEIDGKSFSLEFGHDPAGNLTSVKYPDDRVIRYDYRNSGRLYQVYDETRICAVASGLAYEAFGGLKTFNYLNGIAANWGFNSRLQPETIKYGKSGSPLLLNLSLDYYNPSLKNNGNILKIIDNLAIGKTIKYTYDDLNRLQIADNTVENSSGWKQTYDYDIYGNLKSKTGTGGATNGSWTITTKNRIQDKTYDAAGNLKEADGKALEYNTRNQLVSAGSAEYAYDVDGNRIVKKINGSNPQTTYYIYGPGGQVLAEYQLNRKGEAVWMKDLIYLNGKMINEVKNSDPNPPVIREVKVVDIGDHQATITWKTDEWSDSQVKYGLTSSYGSESPLNSQKVRMHTATLTNLDSGQTEGKTHHFQVISADYKGNSTASADFTFQTLPDTKIPQYVSVNHTARYVDATIHVVTDEPTQCLVKYGTTSLNPNGDYDGLALSHDIMLKNLAQNTTYQYQVLIKDSVGNEPQNPAAGSFQTGLDTDAPGMPVVSDDGQAQNNTTTLHAIWTCSDGNGSGIAQYQYAIGTTPGGTDELTWTPNGTNTAVTATNLSLTVQTVYYISVKAKDNANNWSAIGSSDGIRVVNGDTTPPDIVGVSDNGPVQEFVGTNGSGTVLYGEWVFNDTAITGYKYAIGTAPGSADTLSWTPTNNTSVSKTNLTLAAGQKYYFSVMAKNSNELWSEIGSSGGIKVVPFIIKTYDIIEGTGQSETINSKGNMLCSSNPVGMEVCWRIVSGAWQERRGICCFSTNTTKIPREAIVTGAKLKAYVAESSAANPNKILLDSIQFNPPIAGSYFSGQYPTGCTDCKNVTQIAKTLHTWAETPDTDSAKLGAKVRLGVNALTQFRLHTSITQQEATGDYDGVNYSTLRFENRPLVLSVTCRVPQDAVTDPPYICQEQERTPDQLFYDSFCQESYITIENPAQGWNAKQGAWQSTYGVFYIDYQEPADPAINPDAVVAAGDPSWTDYKVNFKVRPDWNQAKFALAVRYDPLTGNGYYFRVEADPQVDFEAPIQYHLILEKVADGITTVLGLADFSHDLNWFTMETMANGMVLTASIDGSPLITAIDSDISNGQVALTTANQLPLTVFDEFKVTDIYYYAQNSKIEIPDGFGTRPLSAPLSETSSGTTSHTSHLTSHNAFPSPHTSRLTSYRLAPIPPLPIMGLMLLPLPPEGTGAIQITSPNGGENWEQGSLYEIKWTGGSAGETIKIEYSLDDGTNWVTPAISTTAANTGVYRWQIPFLLTNNCRIRVTSASGSDQSDGVFSLASCIQAYDLDADFNGDGISDMLWRYDGSGPDQGLVQLWLMSWNSGAGTAGVAETKNLGQIDDLSWRICAARDFNNDSEHRADILWRYEGSGSNQGANLLWIINPDWTITSRFIESKPDLSWRVCAVRDVNNDGIADILWRYYGQGNEQGKNELWLMYPDGNHFTVLLPTVSDLSWKVCGIGGYPYDGQLRSGIFWRYYGCGPNQGANCVWCLDNNGTTLAGITLTTIPDLNWKITGVGDFNTGGIADLLWRYYGQDPNIQGYSGIWLLDGAGSFTESILPRVSSLDWRICGIGDFDDDNVMDILWRYYGTDLALGGHNALWYMDASGHFRQMSNVDTVQDTNWSVFNGGDSAPDTIAPNPNPNPEPETSLCYHHDHLGTVRIITDKNADVVESFDPLPFGDLVSAPSSTDKIIFTGKERDAESGLDYFAARYYSSKMGRFMSTDQITIKKDSIFNPQGWNLYAYCLNNPLNMIDPDGNSAIDTAADIYHTGLWELAQARKAQLEAQQNMAGVYEWLYQQRVGTPDDMPKPPGVGEDWTFEPNNNWDPDKPSQRPGKWIDPSGKSWQWDPDTKINHPDPVTGERTPHWDVDPAKGVNGGRKRILPDGRPCTWYSAARNAVVLTGAAYITYKIVRTAAAFFATSPAGAFLSAILP